jgi:NADH dehydrogenase [ubiquinone] 1 alpha subcomplex assembly factor 5
MPPDDHSPPLLFDQRQLRLHRLRALTTATESDFLHTEMIEGLLDRLSLINRSFGCALDFGSRSGQLSDRLPVGQVIRLEPAAIPGALTIGANLDTLPLADNSVDLIVSAGALHWVNDLPGLLAQVHRVLKPDGLFLAAMPGGSTLQELRLSLAEAESDARGGATRRVGPFLDVRDAGALLQRAGFAMPVADSERLTVHYRDISRLLTDLRAMGETGCYAARGRPALTRGIIADGLGRYASRFADANGQSIATFDILYLCGWAKAEGQPKPLRPGSAKVRLADALGTREQPLKP